MTDEASQPAIPPESTPTQQPSEPVAATPTPERILAAESVPPAIETPAAPAVPPEAVSQISDVITEAVQKSLAPKADVLASTLPPSPAQPVAAPSAPTPKGSAGAHMRQVVQKRKQERLEKIMEMANKKLVIVNRDVQKLLNVSDPTATRYLEELVKTGHLKRTGVRRAARYEPMIGSHSAM